MRFSSFFIPAALLLVACSSGVPDDGTVLLDSNAHYTLRYPKHWTVTRNVVMPEAGYDTLGTKLTYPAESDHTTLTNAAMHISLRAECPTLEKADVTGDATTDVIGGKTWQHVVRDGVGAGNRYQGDTYMIMYENQCYTVSTLLHSCNLGPDCGEGHTTPFDKAKLDAAFRAILSTFTFRG